jgi:hypothetical protein
MEVHGSEIVNCHAENLAVAIVDACLALETDSISSQISSYQITEGTYTLRIRPSMPADGASSSSGFRKVPFQLVSQRIL